MKATSDPPVTDSSSPAETAPPSSTLARVAGGAIAGGLIGVIADPLTAVVGAAACAIIGAAADSKGPDDS